MFGCRLYCGGYWMRRSVVQVNNICSRMAIAPLHTRFLVVGLGNLDLPKTRHSIGMQLVDCLAKSLDVRWSRDKSMQGFTAEKSICISQGHDRSVQEICLILLKSKQPMNLNGKSVARAASLRDVAPQCVYLLHDDLDKSCGKFAIKENGSARGHKGVKSSTDCLRTDEVPRLRIGIDRPADRAQVVDYVLSAMTREEADVFRDNVTDMLTCLFRHMERRAGLKKDSLRRTIL